ncbi:splicing factor 45 spf45 [Anaeramoeba ignava]|uniref:Splicing factor 45 spf45 n=1 Tax=Anaeramoeba ignava TaxID=1746090 RepID=A0A9Q0R5U6_ANAIG|nr:splicing factor 45 spf45 [Anaeramoeba ignava]
MSGLYDDIPDPDSGIITELTDEEIAKKLLEKKEEKKHISIVPTQLTYQKTQPKTTKIKQIKNFLPTQISRTEREVLNPFNQENEQEKNSIEVIYEDDDFLDQNFADEYDPWLPNDYDKSCAERTRQFREGSVSFERQKLNSEMNFKEEQDDQSRKGSDKNFAKNVLQKFGWKPGKGLGRNEDGVVYSLNTKKSTWTKNQTIENMAHDEKKELARIERKDTQKSKNLENLKNMKNVENLENLENVENLDNLDNLDNLENLENEVKEEQKDLDKLEVPTLVILLLNLVGKGEVDNDLTTEVQEECTRFGNVESCFVFEVIDESVPGNEAVRVFVKFSDLQSSIKGKNKF